MKTFNEYITEMTVDILSTKDIKSKLQKQGFEVKTDPKHKGTFIVTIDDDKTSIKLTKWMLKNGWDRTDIKDGYDELKQFL